MCDLSRGPTVTRQPASSLEGAAFGGYVAGMMNFAVLIRSPMPHFSSSAAILSARIRLPRPSSRKPFGPWPAGSWDTAILNLAGYNEIGKGKFEVTSHRGILSGPPIS